MGWEDGKDGSDEDDIPHFSGSTTMDRRLS
jgi:hypothetical protein